MARDFAYIGSGEFAVKVRVLGSESLKPGVSGLVRLHLAQPLPLVRGDRFVLREAGRDETVGGGEVLDVAPVKPASKATPDRDTDRLIDEHGFITADDLLAWTGERREPTLGNWVVAPTALERMQQAVRARVAGAGDLGLDVASLDERERAVLPLLDGIAVEAGRARPAAVKDPLADHPFLAVLHDGGVAPPDAVGIDKVQLRELVRRKLVVERDSLHFHPAAIDTAAHAAARLLQQHPAGFTLSQFREALGNTRKHAVPLATELDARGITRRRDELRIGGPKLPAI